MPREINSSTQKEIKDTIQRRREWEYKIMKKKPKKKINTKTNKPKIVGQECKCGASYQHIHKEGWKYPISVVMATEAGLLDESESVQDLTHKY